MLKTSKNNTNKKLHIRQSHRVSAMYQASQYQSSWEEHKFETDFDVADQNLSLAFGGNVPEEGR
jgi:hypothetical protein